MCHQLHGHQHFTSHFSYIREQLSSFWQFQVCFWCLINSISTVSVQCTKFTQGSKGSRNPENQGTVTTDNNCCITSAHPDNALTPPWLWPQCDLLRWWGRGPWPKYPAIVCTSVLWCPLPGCQSGMSGRSLCDFVICSGWQGHWGTLSIMATYPHNTLLSPAQSDSRFSMQIKSHI